MMIIEDRDLIYDVKDYDIVLVGLNIMNTMGNGFPHKVAVSFRKVSEVNKGTAYGDPRKLGTVKVVPGEPTFCLCYISRGRYRPDIIPDAVDYEALENQRSQRQLEEFHEILHGHNSVGENTERQPASSLDEYLDS